LTDERANHSACQSEEIAAYLDGELDSVLRQLFEEHLKECPSCATSLEEQKRLLRMLDFALGNGGGVGEAGLALPLDFAQRVAVRAENDMSGVRRASEHGVALRVSAVLALVSFSLLGGAAISESVVQPAFALFRHVASILDFAWRVLYDAGAGLTVISRDFGGHLLFESHPLVLLACLLLAVALVLLLRRIGSYQRA
jgi:predicted anti-sigma-YlaC factor YlaD